ncbi:hypothetical protein AYO21_01004 [Fonsecaea monophora]|uniref:Uncharacterized protein n=1 Tax=Fonsecaea monophora TaxID=254056 RepID=A0A177FJM9_9EURO|nr:hypothetical protein AYO21_01004 [Fonsecaea monophora]OAG44514.1 hypothetical protein AYO21_01004 [Fonsecaea monophora]
MTRRKGWPSPPLSAVSRIPVSFEIPASLQQFSTISRSLAATMASRTGPYDHPLSNSTSISQASSNPTPVTTQSQHRPSSQSSSQSISSHSTAPRVGQYATTKANPLKRSFSEVQRESRAVHQPTFSRTALQNAQQTDAHLRADAKSTTVVAEPSSHSPQTPHTNIPTTTQPEEPPLKAGEALVLATHPNTIAQLIARKRAENEMSGHRERWARRQQEYRMSQSPVTQSGSELNHQVARNEVTKAPPKSRSNPPLGRSVSAIPIVKPVTSIVFDAQTSVAESPSTTATEESTKPAEYNSETRQSNDNDSFFESPFSSPIVEFLEKATDNAGLKEPLRQQAEVSNTTVTTATTAPKSHLDRGGGSTNSTSTTAKFQEAPAIPPLFSDKPLPNQSQPQSLHTSSSQSPSMSVQQQAQTESLTPVQGQLPQHQPRGGPPQLAPRQLPAPRNIPYYPQNVGMPAFYRVEMNQSWPGGGNDFISTPVSTVSSNPGYDQHVLPPSLSYNPYGVGSMAPYLVGPDLPPPPGPLRTYGSMMATEVAGPSREQLIDAGHITAADMVAGINTRFKIATKDDFTVPKR